LRLVGALRRRGIAAAAGITTLKLLPPAIGCAVPTVIRIIKAPTEPILEHHNFLLSAKHGIGDAVNEVILIGVIRWRRISRRLINRRLISRLRRRGWDIHAGRITRLGILLRVAISGLRRLIRRTIPAWRHDTA
jgi:hypothetical protein